MPFPTFATQAEIPKGFESEYEEGEDKKWHSKDTAEAVRTELAGELDDERTKRKAAELLTRKAADDLRKLQTKQKADAAGLTDEQLKALRAEVTTELEAEYAPFKEQAESLAAAYRTVTIVNEAKKMAGEKGFLAERLENFWKLYGDDFDQTADGKLMVKGKPGIDPAKHIEGLTKLQPSWVAGTKATGGGAPGGTRGNTGTSHGDADLLKNPKALIASANAEAA